MIAGFLSKFECKVSGYNESLTVLDFTYDAGLSKLYQCQINLISSDCNLDYWSFVDKNATLTINVQSTDALQYINGVITTFTQMGKVGDHYIYQIILEPHITQMKHQEKTEVYLNQSIPDIIEAHFKIANIQHYRLDLSQSYQPREFVCQFQESDFNFVSRWMEHEGIYYYFEQGSDYETLVLTDRYSTHKDHPHFSELIYNQENITITSQSSNTIEAFSSHITKVAKTLILKGYNYNDDTKTITTSHEVSSHGIGSIEIYDENVLSESDAKRIAEIRAQAIACQEQIFYGKTMVTNITPGYRFTLKNHFRKANNQEYLVFDMTQQGSQRDLVLAHLGNHLMNDQAIDTVVFITEFKAIPGKVQFRAPSDTPLKRIDGIIPAILDAETSGEYAQLDNQGRYKIRLLHSDKPSGQASDWVRKMESYLGNQYGNHFPLHKNTEICLAFEFGNPDRPIIIGVVHNSSNKNVVTSTNQKTSVTKSAGGNMMVMGDQKGQEYTHFYSPVGNTELILGSVGTALAATSSSSSSQTTQEPWTSDWPAIFPKPSPSDCSTWSYTKQSTAYQQFSSYYKYMKGDSATVTKGNSWAQTWGNQFSLTMGATESFKLANDFSTTLGASQAITLGIIKASWNYNPLVIDYTVGKLSKKFDFAGNDVTTVVVGNWTLTVGEEIAITSGAGSITNTATTGNIVNTAPIAAIENTSTFFKVTADTTTVTSENGTLLTSGDSIISQSPTNIEAEANAGITLTCDESSLEITPAGITISAGETTIEVTPAGITLTCGASFVEVTDGSITGGAPMVDISP
ncbi:MAG: type VI secretion system tip protein VgrG [Gammaproteobacteria bacterium]|nr:MAG: type VI secretion system tip protein VgrG [Gammaproteobacteria bacterium]UTW42698.1 type VI secretion system tip protein VgrG [bacterium SCSIO 12844]